MMSLPERIEEARRVRDENQANFEMEFKTKKTKVINDLVKKMEEELINLWGLALQEDQHNYSEMEVLVVTHAKTSGVFKASREEPVRTDEVLGAWEWSYSSDQPSCPAVGYDGGWFYYEPSK